MEGLVLVGQWTSAAALQGEAANHPELLRSRAVVVSVAGKVALPARQVWAKKASASEPLMTCRKGRPMTSKPGLSARPGMSLAGACLLARRCPAWRWRELGPGSGAERVNLSSRARGRPVVPYWPAAARASEDPKRLIRKGQSSDAGHRGGPSRSSDEAR
jgi:hypothetical protein